MLDGQDISAKFHEYRNQCLTASFDNLANYFNEILSLSGILVLQQRVEYGNPSASLFPSSLLNAMRKQLLSTLYKCKKFDAKILPTDYIKDDVDDYAARIQLLQLCGDLKDEEHHVLQAIVELISSLYDCNMKTPSESHLESSYVHPFIHGLFSSKCPSKIAH
ncbi:hypothetical protein G6F46_013167 [Rhizopus delemar]|uniref:Uncharacterized protein n=2 Tax=Rhizopus TaxID=4842 RepID=A0A9P6YFE5_9FUNG|nr:hypothetical protein G6F55_013116 [Rhizopus delemar]KAG1531870.1 hypothetical protein G6F51_013349 [Rhizopus arrhizus]KAG1496917.1 hypothetical protein G6F52_012889 [Rhizopus delemar]KAG1546627.1 hypothetical protein G6F50_013615 [Rhizopus delemar]KAG1576816.1 hypothetical protein G6F47_013337 [Rhizopus delemar]